MKATIKGKCELKILRGTYNKMMAYAKYAKGEISGLGYVNEDNVIYDVLLFDQISSGSSTDLNMEDVRQFIFKLIEEDEDKIKDVKLWWHSHVNMVCDWSPTDEENISEMIKDTPNLFSIVINKREQSTTRRDVLFEGEILTFDDMDLTIIDDNTDKMMDDLFDNTIKVIEKYVDKYPNILKVIYENDEAKGLTMDVTFNNNLTDTEMATIEKEVETKNKLPVPEKKDIELTLSGHSPALNNFISLDPITEKYFVTKPYGKRTNLTKRQLRLRKLEVTSGIVSLPNINSEKQNFNVVANFPWDILDISKRRKKDDDKINKLFIFPDAINIYYSGIRTLLDKIDETTWITQLIPIVKELGWKKISKVKSMDAIYKARSVLANEVLAVLIKWYGIDAESISEFLEHQEKLYTNLKLNANGFCFKV